MQKALASTLFALALLMPATAGAAFRALKPPADQNFFGVTDTGEVDDFRDFAAAAGKHPAVIQTFHGYGNSLHEALPRWQSLRTRPMLHISTIDYNGVEVMTPRAIARGKGDDYLLRLNRTFADAHMPAYIRPLGEPNRCLNAYSAYDCVGNFRGSRYSPRAYRQAFRRMYILLHGGGSIALINRKLRSIGLPPVERRLGSEPASLPKAPVALIWSPLPAGSPIARYNRPGRWFPGARYVDWVATDFYSRYPYWKNLGRFFQRFSRRYRKPFAFTEWGVWGEDDPRFVRDLFRFCHLRPRCRMLVYYQDFGSPNEFRIQNYPSSQSVLRQQIRGRRYPALAPNPPEPPPPPQPTGGLSSR